MRILISACGGGFGHTTRCLSIANKFKMENKKNEILFLSYGKNKEFIEKSGYKVEETYPDVIVDSKDGNPYILDSIKKTIFETNLLRTIHIEYNIIKRYKPNLILIDHKYSTAIVALLFKKKYYLITNVNQVNLNFKENNLIEIIGYLGFKGLHILNKRAQKVIIPDLPLPNTICEYSIIKTKNTVFSGPLIRYDVKRDYKPIKGDYILGLIGGFTYRSRILEELIKIGNKEKKKIKIVCGNHKEMYEKLKEMAKFKGIEIFLFVDNMEDLIKKSSFIVCPGGHSTLMEAVSFGKPVITIPDLNQPEQENNSKKVAELGFGILLTRKELDKLNDAIKEMENNQKYFDKAAELSEMAKNSNQNFLKIIES